MSTQPQPVDLSLSEGHTPGPWRKKGTDVDGDDATLFEGQSANIGDIDIAVSVDYADWDEAIRKEQAANQELLFAAPAMRSELVRLRELLGLVLQYDSDGEVVDCLVPDAGPERTWKSLGDLIRAALSQEVSE